jgi:hypothetical protein
MNVFSFSFLNTVALFFCLRINPNALVQSREFWLSPPHPPEKNPKSPPGQRNQPRPVHTASDLNAPTKRTRIWALPVPAAEMAANLEDVPSLELMHELLRRMKCSSKPDKRLILIGTEIPPPSFCTRPPRPAVVGSRPSRLLVL